jgi:DNA-binding transcriptional LysR family regulator
LSSFIAVAKLKSFAQAATVLYVSQPTRTAQIKKFKYALRCAC